MNATTHIQELPKCDVVHVTCLVCLARAMFLSCSCSKAHQSFPVLWSKHNDVFRMERMVGQLADKNQQLCPETEVAC